jgi:exopolyphosphatase/guanosine-5'-triphosphate,3'-diphosphate pyrophosphatase
MPKIAVIDLGTNTFNLLIASLNETSGFDTLYHTKIGVALGMGGINEQLISEDAIERAMNALHSYKQKCDELEVDEIRTFGTSAIRDAKNGSEFCELVKSELGLTIRVISGLKEAQLIYQGVKWSYDYAEPAIIMDIGGGSTEFILADKTGVQKAVSLNIGVSRIYQQLKLGNPITNNDIQTIENWLEEHSEGKLDGIQCDILIGSSGTFETLHEVYFQEKFPTSKNCIPMSIEELQGVLDHIIQSTLEEREQNPFIIPIRQIMIPIASVKINWILKKIGVKQLLISPYSLKEGALL